LKFCPSNLGEALRAAALERFATSIGFPVAATTAFDTMIVVSFIRCLFIPTDHSQAFVGRELVGACFVRWQGVTRQVVYLAAFPRDAETGRL
jgi:hypothetical protein